MPRVNPNILRWARETAGLSPEDAARKVGLKAARGKTPPERVAALESGEAQPTQAQLRNMAKQYRRPLVAFYLSKQPERGDKGEDFRSLPDAAHRTSDPLVEALLRDIKARQEMVRDLLSEDRDQKPLSFIGSARRTEGIAAVAQSISAVLGFRLETFRAQKNPEQAFAYLRHRVEAQGIFVLLAGNLGSHHTAIEVEVFRGFALADAIAPFVVINDQDARAAWAFTLFHELVHLWLGQTGISGTRIENASERFCSDVASTLLLPDIAIFANVPGDPATMLRAVSEFAKERNVSASMVAYRLHLSGGISAQQWAEMAAFFRRQWLDNRAQAREKAKLSEGGPNYYIIRRHRVGNALLSLVSRALSEGSLTPTKAGRVLGVKPRSVAPLLSSSPTPWAA